MKAALAGRQDPSLVVAGRSSAIAIEGLGEGIRRAKAYQDVGVDAVFMTGIESAAQLEALNAELNIPILLGGVAGDLTDRAYLGSQGVRIALQGHLPFMAAIKATYDTLKALRDGVRAVGAFRYDGVVGTGGAGYATRGLRRGNRRVVGVAEHCIDERDKRDRIKFHVHPVHLCELSDTAS